MTSKAYFHEVYPMILFIFGMFLLTMAIIKIREIKIEEIRQIQNTEVVKSDKSIKLTPATVPGVILTI